MSRYAENTDVSSDRSKAQIERTLQRYDADQFYSAADWKDGHAMIGFRFNEKQIRFVLKMPSKDDREFHETPTGRDRTAGAALKAWQQACRQRWRALALVIKAKLEAVESGICSFEKEFLANIMLPDGTTVGDVLMPQVEQAYLDGKMPPLLPDYGGKKKRKR